MGALLPAHHTKHLPVLRYPYGNAQLQLAQLDDGRTNGTGLWLGAQCLSLYLADVQSKLRSRSVHRRPRAIELGSGIGLTALALAYLGWDVVATDVPIVLPLLRQNIAQNIGQLPPNAGTVQVRELDWNVPHSQWSWIHPEIIASTSGPNVNGGPTATSTDASESDVSDPSVELLCPPFDLILTADTLYSSDLVAPLFRSLQSLLTESTAGGKGGPAVLAALERRDPAFITDALACAQTDWRLAYERVPHRKVAKAMQKGGVRWAAEEWEGIEIWKLSAAGESDGDKVQAR